MSISVTDVFMTIGAIVAAWAVSPFINDRVSGMDADPLTTLFMNLVIPLLFIGIIVSIGVSASRD